MEGSFMKKLPMYDLPVIVSAGEIEAFAFEELKEDPAKGIEVIRQFRTNVESLLTDFDARWIRVCNGDTVELTEWASRMRLVRSMLDEIDRHLAVAGSRLFDWNKVLGAMGFLNSFRVAAEQVLGMNEELAA
jgi:hypothetical protein